MTRVLSALLIAALLCSATACGKEVVPESSAPTTTITTTTEESTPPTEDTTTTEEVTTTTLPSGGNGVGISTMKGHTTTFKKYTTAAPPTTTTATTGAPVTAQPVMDTPYVCWMTGGTDLIVATVTFTDAGCVITRTFYTCDSTHKVYGTNVDSVNYHNTTYYKTAYAPQAAARYEIVGINIQVYNADGSVAKTFVMPKSNAMECSFSDGVAFGRSNRFILENE